jgi:hypothetical protein
MRFTGAAGRTVYEVVIYSKGLVACSVCAPAEMKPDEVEAEVNLQNPTGILSCWKISEDSTFRQGGPNPGPCDATANRRHWLLNC